MESQMVKTRVPNLLRCCTEKAHGQWMSEVKVSAALLSPHRLYENHLILVGVAFSLNQYY